MRPREPVNRQFLQCLNRFVRIVNTLKPRQCLKVLMSAWTTVDKNFTHSLYSAFLTKDFRFCHLSLIGPFTSFNCHRQHSLKEQYLSFFVNVPLSLMCSMTDKCYPAKHRLVILPIVLEITIFDSQFDDFREQSRFGEIRGQVDALARLYGLAKVQKSPMSNANITNLSKVLNMQSSQTSQSNQC